MLLLASCGLFGMLPAGAAHGSEVVLRGSDVAVEARVVDGRLEERYLARRGDAWIVVAVSEGTSVGPVSLLSIDGRPIRGTVRGVRLSGGALIEELTVGEHRLLRTLTLATDGPWLRVTTQLDPPGPAELHALTDTLRFTHRSRWSFAPSVGGFVPDAQYKAPLVLVQAEGEALAVVPDLVMLDRPTLKRCSHALDLDVPAGPLLSVGFTPARLSSHSVYAPDPDGRWSAEDGVRSAYYVLVTATAETGKAYRQAVRFHWETFGRPAQRAAAAQQRGTDERYRSLALWDGWREVVWGGESRQRWLRVTLPGGATGGGVATRRWGPAQYVAADDEANPPSIYLSSWFNTLRTSYGMALHARRSGDEELLERARQTVEVALKAPGRGGAFKCIAVDVGPDEPLVWAAGDGSGGSTRDGYLGYDMSWTGYWLLMWREAGLPRSEGVLPRCRGLAEFFLARQGTDGMLPTRFLEDGTVDVALSRRVMAETGPVVLFLLQLHAADPDPRYLAAGLRGLAFLEREVVPERKWYDYETFFSCSPREIHFDARSGQWPANDLALGQAVAAYILAYRITEEPGYLAGGEALLDYLLLYQQSWTNPALQGLSSPTMLLGGFTTMNSDAEWSDARQSQLGSVLLDYYRATGKVEYLERGVAALRAQFPVSPSENWAHEGYGDKAGVSSFHWGTGSGMAGIEIEEDFLRDVVVDVAAGRGVGVNGIDVVECVVRDTQIDLTLTTPYRWSRRPVIAFRQVDPDREYRLTVNGAEVGRFPGRQLAEDVPVDLSSAEAR